jgi:NAD(P)-dependent dehydrogenase (short-subunit alcohol dehydrogenase family)
MLELQFGVNHLAQFALVQRLQGALKNAATAGAPARVVTVSTVLPSLRLVKGRASASTICTARCATVLRAATASRSSEWDTCS